MYKRCLLINVAFALAVVHAEAQNWLTRGPYLQELTPDGVTVVFEHAVPSVSWIEIREKGQTEATKYFQTVNGRVKSYSQILSTKNSAVPVQNFAIRAEGLKPATKYEYRVKAHKVQTHDSNGVKALLGSSNMYTSTWKEFTTQDPQQTEHHIFITSDMHNKPDSLVALLNYLNYKTCDRIIYNGDMTDFMQDGVQDPYSGYINASVGLFAQNKPFEIVRGNHETRGNMSRHFMDYFPDSNLRETAQKHLFLLQDNLVQKEYLSAKLYYNLGGYFGNINANTESNYEACIITAQNALKAYPYTDKREAFSILIMKSKYYLAKNSSEAKRVERYRDAEDECYGFLNEFPESKEAETAKEYIEKCKKITKD